MAQEGGSTDSPTATASGSLTVQSLLEKAGHNQQVLQRYQQFELQLLNSSGFTELLELLLVHAREHFQLDYTELWLFDPQHTLRELVELDQWGQHLQLMQQDTALTALYGASPTVRLLSTTAQNLPVFHGLPIRSAALLPLVRQHTLVGSLHFGARGHQRFGDDKSTDFIDHLAAIISVCFENSINHERLHRLSMYDVLTQVKNRRAFQQAIEQEVSRASRTGDPLSLLFVDLDHFKSVNDSYGHQAGDQLLKQVAQFMQSFLRKTDHVCRYGGEEFALVLPNCGQQRALEVAERMRQQIADTPLTTSDGEEIRVTLSIGASCWLPMDSDDTAEEDEGRIAEQLLQAADQGVYLAKSGGRNQTVFVD